MLARIRSFGARRAAVVVLATGLVGVAVVPSILAASGPPPASPILDASLTAVDPPARAGRILRGEATVLRRDGSTADVHFERGVVSAASATAVTVKGADGVSTTFTIGSATRLRSHGQKATADALEAGQFVMAVGTKSGSGYDALLIRIRAAKP